MISDQVRFSIVIPVFNQLRYSAQCVESLLAQHVRPEQILVIDNASSDGTPEWVVLLNNDVLAGPDAIGELLDAAERGKTGFTLHMQRTDGQWERH